MNREDSMFLLDLLTDYWQDAEVDLGDDEEVATQVARIKAQLERDISDTFTAEQSP